VTSKYDRQQRKAGGKIGAVPCSLHLKKNGNSGPPHILSELLQIRRHESRLSLNSGYSSLLCLSTVKFWRMGRPDVMVLVADYNSS
jgi:hypothetical protein